MRIQSVNNNYQNKNKQSFGMVRLPDGNLTAYEAIFGAMCNESIEIGRKTITRKGKKIFKDFFLVGSKNDTVGESKVIETAKKHLKIKNPQVVKDEEAEKMIDDYNRANGIQTLPSALDFLGRGPSGPV